MLELKQPTEGHLWELLRTANLARNPECFPECVTFTPFHWAMMVFEELGELLGEIKRHKMKKGNWEALKEEFADVVISVDLLNSSLPEPPLTDAGKFWLSRERLMAGRFIREDDLVGFAMKAAGNLWLASGFTKGSELPSSSHTAKHSILNSTTEILLAVHDLATRYDINLRAAVSEKYNKVCEKRGSAIRLNLMGPFYGEES